MKHSQNDATSTTQLQEEASFQQVKDVWRVYSDAEEEEGVDSSDWDCRLRGTWSGDSLGVLLTDQTGRHFEQDWKSRAMGDPRPVQTSEADDH